MDSNNIGTVMQQHWVMTMIAALLPAVIRSLKEDVTFLPTRASAWRLAIIGALSMVASAVEGFQQNGSLKNAFIGAFVAGGPALLVEILHIVQGKKDDGDGAVGGTHIDTPPPGKSAGPYSGSKMVALVLACAVACSGCAGWQKKVQPVLSDAAAYIADAQEIVSIIRAASTLFFLAHPSVESQVMVEHLLGDVAQGIDAAIRATHGAEAMSREDMDKAWAEFRSAYRALEGVLKDVGVMGAAPGKYGATVNGHAFHEPLCLSGR